MGCLCARQNPVTKRQTDFDFSNAAPTAWQAWSTSTGRRADMDIVNRRPGEVYASAPNSSADAWTSPPMMLWNIFFSDIGELPPQETGAPI